MINIENISETNIERLHLQQRARHNQYYKTPNGQLFVGLSTGHVYKFRDDEIETINKMAEIEEKLSLLQNKVNINTSNINILNTSLNSGICKSIGTAIALGS